MGMAGPAGVGAAGRDVRVLIITRTCTYRIDIASIVHAVLTHNYCWEYSRVDDRWQVF